MSKSAFLFSIEQWEFIRRLHNSGLSKEQVCQAFDDLDRIERELSSLFNTSTSSSSSTTTTTTTTSVNSPTNKNLLFNDNNNNNNLLNILQTQFNSNDSNLINKNLQNSVHLFMAKNIAALNFYQRLVNQTTSAATVNNKSSTTATNSTTSSLSPSPSPLTVNEKNLLTSSATLDLSINSNNNINIQSSINNNNNNNNNNRVISPLSISSLNNNENLNNTSTTTTPTTANSTNNLYTLNLYDIEDEIKELDEFRGKGDINIHQEISHFVHKFDLKQSQIARLAGVNQAYVSKFLRGDFSDLSENGKTLIYKWYLKYSKNPFLLSKQNGQLYSSNNGTNDHLNSNDSSNKAIKLECTINNNINNNPNTTGYSFMNLINSYEAPKRTRFSFKPDHLAILEKSFIENPYPDPKKREELAKLCNNVRNTNDLSDRERVTEQIVTHWFQNKRKLTRRVNCDDSIVGTCNDQLSTSPINDEKIINNSNNNNNYNRIHQQRNQNNGDSLDYDVDDSPIDYRDFMDEAQVAAYKAIMSRMNKSPTSNKSDFNDDLNLNTEIS